MKAVFEFTYETDAGLDVDVHIEGDIYDESDKESLLYAIAEVLGREIAIKQTYEESVFAKSSEQGEELRNED